MRHRFSIQECFEKDLGDFGELVWAKKTKRVPVVFTRDEVRSIMGQLNGVHWIMAMLLYGSGLRLSECLQLRVKDIDFHYNQITIRDAKGKKDRIVPLPQKLREPLQSQLEKVKKLH
ncbi:MAG: tyrosine-type recombinase/integrase, partial [bacterium]